MPQTLSASCFELALFVKRVSQQDVLTYGDVRNAELRTEKAKERELGAKLRFVAGLTRHEGEKTMKALITRKLGMTSTIDEDGTVAAVTLLSASPCVITQIKDVDTDGYQAVQVGFEEVKRVNKAQENHFKKSKSLPKIIREFRTESQDLPEDLKVGSTLTAEVFSVGDIVDVTGTSKGKGFAGTIKRHNFHRQRKTHGGKGNTRKVGSIGSMYPQKIFKGKKMAGQKGAERVTVKNLKIAIVDADKGILAVKGAVPGPRQSVVLVKATNLEKGGK